MRKFFGWVTLSLVVVLVMAACAPVAAPVPAAPAAEGDAAAPAVEPIRIAIIMPSSTTDMAWSQTMYDALKTVQAEMGGESAMEIAFTENMFNVADAAVAIRDYATDGNDIVIAHGTQYGNAMFDVAAEFPETSFAWGTAIDTGADKGLSNVFAYEAKAQTGARRLGQAGAGRHRGGDAPDDGEHQGHAGTLRFDDGQRGQGHGLSGRYRRVGGDEQGLCDLLPQPSAGAQRAGGERTGAGCAGGD